MLQRASSAAPASTRSWVDLDDISPQPGARGARLGGRALLRASRHRLGRGAERARRRGRPLRGASTITMQTVKNLFFPDGAELGPQGAGGAARALCRPLPLQAAHHGDLPERRRVGRRRLRRRGGGASTISGVPAAKLTATQAARLAAVLPSPRPATPAKPGPGTARIARRIAARAARARRRGRLRAELTRDGWPNRPESSISRARNIPPPTRRCAGRGAEIPSVGA